MMLEGVVVREEIVEVDVNWASWGVLNIRCCVGWRCMVHAREPEPGSGWVQVYGGLLWSGERWEQEVVVVAGGGPSWG
jgi:hypothetical protein